MDELLTDDPQKVIELSTRRSPNHGKRKTPNKGGKQHPDVYRQKMAEVLADVTAKRAAELTEAEAEFVDMVVNGSTVAEAYALTHPEKCFKMDRHGEPVLKDGQAIPLERDRLYDRGMKLMDTTRVRAAMRQKLEQEMADVTHTSLVVQNFVRKRLLIESMTAPPAQRLAALKELKSYGEVAARDEERTKNLTSPEQILDAIASELDKLKA